MLEFILTHPFGSVIFAGFIASFMYASWKDGKLDERELSLSYKMNDILKRELSLNFKMNGNKEGDKTRKFVFLIANDRMFSSSNDLSASLGSIIVDYFIQHDTFPEDSFVDEALENMGISCYRFSLPDFISSKGAPHDHMNTVEDMATQVGRGLAFDDQWSTDGTITLLLEV